MECYVPHLLCIQRKVLMRAAAGKFLLSGRYATRWVRAIRKKIATCTERQLWQFILSLAQAMECNVPHFLSIQRKVWMRAAVGKFLLSVCNNSDLQSVKIATCCWGQFVWASVTINRAKLSSNGWLRKMFFCQRQNKMRVMSISLLIFFWSFGAKLSHFEGNFFLAPSTFSARLYQICFAENC